jgi:hypothetical protein
LQHLEAAYFLIAVANVGWNFSGQAAETFLPLGRI